VLAKGEVWVSGWDRTWGETLVSPKAAQWVGMRMGLPWVESKVVTMVVRRVAKMVGRTVGKLGYYWVFQLAQVLVRRWERV
jgi:hypothetical protein